MARAGHCAVCGTDVYLDEAGRCPAGHDPMDITRIWETPDAPLAVAPVPAATAAESQFDGTVIELFGINLAKLLITWLTMGIAYPWALVMKHRYLTGHTIVDGRRLTFDGTGGQLFGTWLKILLLSLITFGIYGLFWGEITIRRWLVRHTHIARA